VSKKPPLETMAGVLVVLVVLVYHSSSSQISVMLSLLTAVIMVMANQPAPTARIVTVAMAIVATSTVVHLLTCPIVPEGLT